MLAAKTKRSRYLHAVEEFGMGGQGGKGVQMLVIAAAIARLLPQLQVAASEKRLVRLIKAFVIAGWGPLGRSQKA